jgi:quinolinate synthase
MFNNDKSDVTKKIKKLKKLRNAVILAHNYQIGEVQDIADFVGDSLELSRKAAQSNADVIVLCGVYFMAETAAILAPEKIVLLPEVLTGCPLADMVTAQELSEKKAKHKDAVTVTYINSTAEVKAQSDICVTSSNAVRVVNSLQTDEILFVPDKNLGSHVAAKTDKKMILWDGYCITHHRVGLSEIEDARKNHPDAIIIIHPECRPEVTALADHVLSTGEMIKFARETTYSKIIVGTEMGLVYRLQKENPNKKFFLLSQGLICPNMKYTNLISIHNALESMKPKISVPQNILEAARLPLERMLAVV